MIARREPGNAGFTAYSLPVSLGLMVRVLMIRRHCQRAGGQWFPVNTDSMRYRWRSRFAGSSKERMGIEPMFFPREWQPNMPPLF
jgi:hypothetical protein